MARELDNQRLRSLREQRGLSQGELARLLGVSRRAVKSWEQDRTPIEELLERLARVLEVQPENLLRDDEPENK